MSVYPVIISQTNFVNHDDLKYPYEERGLQFGDGVYEVIRIYNGTYYLLLEHVNRLFRSAEAIKIELPFTREEITDLLQELLEKNSMATDGKLYLQASRGSAPREHTFPSNVPANVYAYMEDFPRNLKNLSDGVSTITQRDVRWENCYIKSLNLLPNVIAKQEAKENGSYEAILHKEGVVTECSSSNVYLVKDGKIYTHPATNNILHGCVRMRIEKFTRDLDIPLIEEAFSVSDIATADELFLSSSTSEVLPIVKVDSDTIGDGRPGRITARLQEAYERDANLAKHKV
ncbi:D-amino-acid transaminase [Virgibacillus sp. JSM 102003]|uniref:D-amino-acid transaminase n=1 Tax=Virgibacillus sp. JSM 102003 TaxID=1562108 RepID=UPI0035BFB97F